MFIHKGNVITGAILEGYSPLTLDEAVRKYAYEGRHIALIKKRVISCEKFYCGYFVEPPVGMFHINREGDDHCLRVWGHAFGKGIVRFLSYVEDFFEMYGISDLPMKEKSVQETLRYFRTLDSKLVRQAKGRRLRSYLTGLRRTMATMQDIPEILR